MFSRGVQSLTAPPPLERVEIAFDVTPIWTAKRLADQAVNQLRNPTFDATFAPPRADQPISLSRPVLPVDFESSTRAVGEAGILIAAGLVAVLLLVR